METKTREILKKEATLAVDQFMEDGFKKLMAAGIKFSCKEEKCYSSCH